MSEEKHDDPKPLNVSKEDIDKINGRLDGFEKTINGLSGLSGKIDKFINGNNHEKHDNPDDKDPENKKDNPKKDKKADSKPVLDEKSKKRLDELEKWKSDQDNQQKHNHLIDVAKSTAKDKGINLDNSIESFLGDDEDTTKANIEAIAKDFSNVKPSSTEGGFDTSKDIVKDSKSFMNNLLNDVGPKNK